MTAELEATESGPVSAVAGEVRRERLAQGLEPTITDPRALQRIAQLVHAPCPTGREPGGEPPSRETDHAHGGAA